MTEEKNIKISTKKLTVFIYQSAYPRIKGYEKRRLFQLEIGSLDQNVRNLGRKISWIYTKVLKGTAYYRYPTLALNGQTVKEEKYRNYFLKLHQVGISDFCVPKIESLGSLLKGMHVCPFCMCPGSSNMTV